MGAQALMLDDFSTGSSSLFINEATPINGSLSTGAYWGGSRGVGGRLVGPTNNDGYLITVAGGELFASRLANTPSTGLALKLAYGATARSGDSFDYGNDLNQDLSGMQFIRVSYESDNFFTFNVFLQSSTQGTIAYTGLGDPNETEMEIWFAGSPPDLSDIDGIEVRMTNFVIEPGATTNDVIFLDEIELVGAVPEPFSMVGLGLVGALALRRKRQNSGSR